MMIESLARLGYASKAAIYAIIGVLAVLAATNRGGRVTDTSGALRVVLSQPYGRALLLILAVGLCGYAVWRVLDAIADPDHHGTSFKGLVARIGNVIRGGIYGALGVEAFRLQRGLRGSGGNETQAWAAKVMDLPFGDWALVLVGALIAVYGLSEVLSSINGKHDPHVDLSPFPARVRTLLRRISLFGVGARGLILTTVGVVLARAALRHDPGAAAGTRESTIELAGVIEGRGLLLFIAVGLIAYAVDQAVHARCRRMRPVL